ncbi:DUF6600 domain-containing protein [Chitinophagaceae bacterium MMS25-I14]
MKRIFRTLGITGIATMLAITAPVMKSAAQVYDDDQYIDYNNDYNGSYQDFYNSLSPYGQWIQDPQYGYVWLPDAGSDFRPYYTNGRWVMTEYGNTWVSDYPWGWAPFHYGRWTYSSYYGWIWIPGSQWGPAWVSWRSSSDYYGWAPLGPGITVSFSFGSGYSCPMDWWVFIPGSYIYNPRFQSYYRGPRYNQTYINRTTIINNTYINNSTHTTYVTGPRANEIQRVTRQPVHVYQVQNTNRIGTPSIGNNTLSIYRPQIRQTTGTANVRPRPQQVVKPTQSIGRPEAVGSSNGTPPGRTQIFNSRNNATRFQPNNNNSRPVQTTPAQTRPTEFNRSPEQPTTRPTQPVQQQPQRNNWEQSRPVQQQPAQPQQQPQPQRNWQQSRPVQTQPVPQQQQPVRQAPQPQPQPQRNWQQPRPQQAPQQQPQPVRQAPQPQPVRQAPPPQPVRQAPPQRVETPRPQQAPQEPREVPMRR